VILQTLLPVAVLTTFDPGREEERHSLLEEALSWADAVACGPGLGKETWAKETVKQVMLEYGGPLVLDADGINHLSENPEFLKQHKGTMILTPHVGEFSRLTGQKIREVSEQIPEQAVQYAMKHHCICVLKDAPTAIGLPDGRCLVNTTGNNGMSTGGSGDVLTGIIAGLLGQKTEPVPAALLGVWMHGRAGDLAAEQEGTYGLLARHIIEYLPGVMKENGGNQG
jgi:NAD(P)H-hydrate epimerase